VEDFVRLTDNLNDLPEEIPPAMITRLRMALALFDRDHNGKLNAEERADLLKAIQTMMPQSQ
jgi:Ca2+-binding EF-hand superfamily protein